MTEKEKQAILLEIEILSLTLKRLEEQARPIKERLEQLEIDYLLGTMRRQCPFWRAVRGRSQPRTARIFHYTTGQQFCQVKIHCAICTKISHFRTDLSTCNSLKNLL